MNLPNRRPALTYRDAGVDVAAGNRLVDRIKPAVARTRREGVLGGIGGFGGLFEIPAGYRRPVLVAGADGVGTKLRLALDTGRHDGVGIDLVAMCVNDVLAQGAEPLFFLDYYATAKLDEDTAATVVESIAEGCVQAGCALLGGETAEMPGMYAAGDYDLAGFCVGVAEYDRMITGEHITAGDSVIALGSSGPHSNGYSLIRALLDRAGPGALAATVGDTTLEDALLAPTRIYAKPVLALHGERPLKGVAHVTGGGITENLPRMLPEGLAVAIDTASWALPPVFEWLRETAACDDAEMRRTFNCGVGLALCVGAEDAQAALDSLTAAGEAAWVVGEVVEHAAGAERVVYRQ